MLTWNWPLQIRGAIALSMPNDTLSALTANQYRLRNYWASRTKTFAIAYSEAKSTFLTSWMEFLSCLHLFIKVCRGHNLPCHPSEIRLEAFSQPRASHYHFRCAWLTTPWQVVVIKRCCSECKLRCKMFQTNPKNKKGRSGGGKNFWMLLRIIAFGQTHT